MDNIRRIATQYAKTGGSGSQPSNPVPPKPSGTPTQPSTPATRPGGGGGAGGGTGTGGTGSIEGLLNQAGGGNGSVDRVLAGLDKNQLAQQISALLMRGTGINLDGLQALGAVNNLRSIVATATTLLNGSNGGQLSQLWTALGAAAGPLGRALSGVQTYNNVSYAKFENGAIYASDATGAHAVWGKIGDAWAAQGFEHGELGLPIGAEEKRADGTYAQDFEHGTLVFDPETNTVRVEK